MRAALIIAMLAAPVAAQDQQCRPLAMFIERLAEAYGESPVILLTNGTGNILTVWTNPETQTWTITETRPDSMTCLRSSGTGIATVAASAPPNI